MMQSNVEQLLSARTAFAQVAAADTSHDVVVQLGAIDARSRSFVEGMDSQWTWHATFEALYRRVDTSVSELTTNLHCCHKNGIVQTINRQGHDRWFRGGVIDGFMYVHPLHGGALPNLAARLLLRRETDFPRSAWTALEKDWPNEHPFLGIETRTLRSVRIPAISSAWRIDFVHVSTDWPIFQKKPPTERHEITIVWAPTIAGDELLSPPPFTQLEAVLRVLQTVVGETKTELDEIIGQHIDAFEQTHSFS